MVANRNKKNHDVRIWLADLTYTQQGIPGETIPYAIGCIATYTESRINLSNPIRLYKYPVDLIDSLNKGKYPNVIGLSNYIWNSFLSLSFAKRIKELAPTTIIVLGGPSYPIASKEQEEFLKKHPYIDFYVVGEAENIFSELIEKLILYNIDQDKIHGEIASLHSIDESGKVYLTKQIGRIKDLDIIPSPYLSGHLDKFFDGKLVPLVQTKRGCPFGCTFCVQGMSSYDLIARHSPKRVVDEMEYIAKKMVKVREKGGRNDLFLADSNFGMYEEDSGTAKEIARMQDLYEWPEYINVATGKNKKERVLKIAECIRGALRLSASVQSLDSAVLTNIKRKNISTDEMMAVAAESSKISANSYSETILALPGDSKEKHFKTLRTLLEAGFNMSTNHQLQLLPGTEMSTQESKKKWNMLVRYRVYPRCFSVYDVCNKKLAFAEIEETCVGSDILPFQDYLECRKIHLIIQIFHNHGTFEALLCFIRRHGLSVFKWIKLIADYNANGRIKKLFENFMNATSNELWESRESLREYLEKPGVVEKYINGELGSNLLSTFHSLAIIDYVDELGGLADSAFRKLLKESNLETTENLTFLEDALCYHVCRMRNILSNMNEKVVGIFRYDINRFISEKGGGNLHEYLLQKETEYEFNLNDSQRSLLKRYIPIFGNDSIGIGRMFAKIFVKKLFRDASPVSELE